MFDQVSYFIMHLAHTITSLSNVAPFFNAFPSIIPTAAASVCYIATTNILYLARRSHLRSCPKREIFKVRTTREDGVSRRFHIILVLYWQFFVLSIFPILEPMAMSFGRTSFYFTYPNAHGAGIILEPLEIQHLKANKRAKEQIRFDWHRFTVNVGRIDRYGNRHPPSVTRNLPHIDCPRKGLKHWPWNRKFPKRKLGGNA